MSPRLSRAEIAEIGIYDFLGYIGAFNSPFIGGMEGTRRLLNKLDITSENEVLEVGCASGFTSCMVAEEYSCALTGIDISEILVNKARERAEKKNLSNTRFLVADALDLPFENDTFDSVFGVAITALIPDKLRVLREYMRVTKPGGKIGTLDLFVKEGAPDEVREKFNGIFMDILGSENEIMSIDEWNALFQQTGFQDIEVEENYSSVFEMPQNRGNAAGATLHLVYHMMINGTVRKRVRKLLGMRKTISLRSEGEYENVGYLIFTAKKPEFTIFE
ncbi:MAG: class I SAM-dependent methyltransferase [Candidatus Thorarchaeota archaeon]